MLDRLAGEPGMPRILAISEDLKGGEVVNPFLQEHKFLHLQTWLDPQANLSLGYGGNLPTTVLYGKDGKEIWRMLGGYDWSSDEAKALLAEANAAA